MHGQKVTLNRVDKENYHLTFNFVQINERIFICHSFSDTAVGKNVNQYLQ